MNKKHEANDWKPTEVANYQEALQYKYPVTSMLILDLHMILMDKGDGTQSTSGEFKKIQNFIGPSNNNEEAVYIPISVNDINDYMNNWEAFINGLPTNNL